MLLDISTIELPPLCQFVGLKTDTSGRLVDFERLEFVGVDKLQSSAGRSASAFVRLPTTFHGTLHDSAAAARASPQNPTPAADRPRAQKLGRGISRQSRTPSAHTRRDHHLRGLVRASHDASRRAYGRPRIWKDLVEQGERVSEKRVGRLMREEGVWHGRRAGTTTMSDHDQPVAANVLDRQFTADRPNERWVGDTLEFLVGGGTKLFVASILDLFSRFAVGWAVSAVNDRHLTIKALEMAIKRRCPEAGLLHHADQGCTLGFNGSSQRVRMSWEFK